MIPVHWTLASIPAANDVFNLFILFVLAALVAGGGFWAAMAIRRWTQRDSQPSAFTLQDLRDMRARGDITDAEFSAMRAAVLAGVTSHAQTNASDQSGAPPKADSEDRAPPRAGDADQGEAPPG